MIFTNAHSLGWLSNFVSYISESTRRVWQTKGQGKAVCARTGAKIRLLTEAFVGFLNSKARIKAPK